MYHNIIKHFRWSESQQAVKVEIAFAVAASPTRPLRADRNLIILHPYDGCIVLDSLCYKLSGFLPQDFHFLLCELFRCGQVTTSKVFFYPVRFTFNESFDIVPPHPFRTAYNNTPVGHDLNADGFPVTSNDLI